MNPKLCKCGHKMEYHFELDYALKCSRCDCKTFTPKDDVYESYTAERAVRRAWKPKTQSREDNSNSPKTLELPDRDNGKVKRFIWGNESREDKKSGEIFPLGLPDKDVIKIVDWTFPNNDEDFMKVTINLNGYLFEGEVQSYNYLGKPNEPKEEMDTKTKTEVEREIFKKWEEDNHKLKSCMCGIDYTDASCLIHNRHKPLSDFVQEDVFCVGRCYGESDLQTSLKEIIGLIEASNGIQNFVVLKREVIEIIKQVMGDKLIGSGTDLNVGERELNDVIQTPSPSLGHPIKCKCGFLLVNGFHAEGPMIDKPQCW